jgi:uncharacterized protein
LPLPALAVTVQASDNRPMRPSESLRLNRDAIKRFALAHRIKRVWVFGSVARGDDRESSDVDLLVEPAPGATLFDLGALQQHASNALRLKVDVVEVGALPAAQRDRILAEAIAL